MKMDARTLTALQGSIRKWERILDGTWADRGYYNCPLCLEFLDAPKEDRLGCPVRARTGKAHCDGSPYEAWFAYMMGEIDVAVPARVFNERSRELAQEELDFLRSLLPQEES